MVDISKEAVERTFQDVIDTIAAGEFYEDYDQSSADLGILRAQAARIAELEGREAHLVGCIEEWKVARKQARNDALREAVDEVHQECWTDGPMSETLMAEQATTSLAIRAIRALIKEPTT